jgi:hypothetical protein
MRDLKQELDTWTGYPPAWKPKLGDALVGFIDGYDIGHTPFGAVRTCIVTEEASNKKVSLWLSTTVLLDLFQKHKPKPGEKIGLKYLGKDEEKRYHRYRLLIDRPDEIVDFSPLGGEDREESSPWQN